MANDEHEEKPLTPAIKPPPPPITVDEALSIELREQHRGFRNRTICCGIIAAVILIISVVMLILGFTIFHVKNPKINLNSVTLTGLDRVNSTGLPSITNLTVVADVSVKNPNVAAYKFEKTNSTLYYRGTVVSVANIPAGVAKARRTMRLDVRFPVMVGEITGNPQFVSDFTLGILPVESYTKIIGKVKILHIIKRKVTVTMNCSIAVNVASQTIVHQECNKHVSI